jgi:hypothetical protein
MQGDKFKTEEYAMTEYRMPPLTQIVKIILILYGIFFFLFLFFPGITHYFALSFQETAFANLSLLYRVFTYTLINSNNIISLIFFGLFMWWVGGRLEESWGRETFISFFLMTVSVSGFICLLIFHFTGLFPGVFSSAGITFGIIAVFAYLTPNSPFYFFGIFPIKVKWLLVISLILTFSDPSPVMILYHLILQLITGLVAVAFVFIKFPLPTWATPYLGSLKNSIEKMKINFLYNKRKNTFTIYRPPSQEEDSAADSGSGSASEEETARTRKQIDALLDKIRTRGINSLTRKERKFLDKHSANYQSSPDDE